MSEFASGWFLSGITYWEYDNACPGFWEDYVDEYPPNNSDNLRVHYWNEQGSPVPGYPSIVDSENTDMTGFTESAFCMICPPTEAEPPPAVTNDPNERIYFPYNDPYLPCTPGEECWWCATRVHNIALVELYQQVYSEIKQMWIYGIKMSGVEHFYFYLKVKGGYIPDKACLIGAGLLLTAATCVSAIGGHMTTKEEGNRRRKKDE